MNYRYFLFSPGRYDLRDKVTVSYYSRFVDTDPDAPSEDASAVTMTYGDIAVSCADYDNVAMNEIAAACHLLERYVRPEFVSYADLVDRQGFEQRIYRNIAKVIEGGIV